MNFVMVDDNEIYYHSPLDVETVDALQNLLRAAQCFSPSFAISDPYLIETYVVQFAWHRNDVTFLIDRNVYSQVVALAKGVRATESMRLAAGIMAFASCANAAVEPNLALYEGSASGAVGSWRNDLKLFHEAAQIHPGNWAALALGRAQKFDLSRAAGKYTSVAAQK